MDKLGDSDLDALALVEAPPLSAADEKEYRRAFPDWGISSMWSGRISSVPITRW
jgi:hypothetical protein